MLALGNRCNSPSYAYRGAARQRGTRLFMLPDSKTGRKAVRLSPPSLAVLHDIPRLEGNPCVICGEKAGRHLVNIEQPWRRIRKTARLDDLRLHDLRHSFASVAASGGQSLIVIGKMLGHSQPATTACYAHLADDPVKAASDAVGRHIAAAMDGGTQVPRTDLSQREGDRARQTGA